MDNLVEIRSKPTRPRVFASRTLPLKAWDDIGVPVPTDGLVRGLLGTQSLAVLYGEPASGKTFVALDMGLHIALGREWLEARAKGGAIERAAQHLDVFTQLRRL